MCNKCIQMEKDGKSFFCVDCSNDISIHGIAEWFMVSDSVWKEGGAGKEDDLCVGCLEKRLGRKLVPDDFGSADGFFPVNEIFEHSPRLRDRLGLKREMGTIDGMVLRLLASAAAKTLRKRLDGPRPGYHTTSEGY